jgi:hypothetical protein
MSDFILKLSHIEKPLIKLPQQDTIGWVATHGFFVDLHGDVELFHTVVKVVETFKVGLFSLG